jgi:ribosomal protein S12 methylthiotransferase
VIVTGCLGVEADRIRAAHPGVLAITGPHQYEAVVAEVHKAVPRPHDPCLDPVPPQGVKLTPRHYAYVKISKAATIVAASASSRHCAGGSRAVPWAT